MKFKALLIILLSIVVGCKSTQLPKTESNSSTVETVTIIQRDTTLIIEKDSTFYKSYIECINNKPILKTPVIKTNKKSKIKTRVNLSNNVLTVDCYKEAQELFVKWKEKYISKVTQKNKKVIPPPKLIEKKLSWWQKLWIALGKIFGLAVVGYITTKIQWKRFLLKLFRQHLEPK